MQLLLADLDILSSSLIYKGVSQYSKHYFLSHYQSFIYLFIFKLVHFLGEQNWRHHITNTQGFIYI